MATRGYIRLVNSEKESEDPYFGYKEDQLVEAFHDGYLSDMLRDLLQIPMGLVHLHEADLGRIFFNKNSPMNWVRKENSLEDLLKTCNSALVPFETHWLSPLSLLQVTKPFKYDIINPGADRYNHPIDLEDACITVSCIEARLLNRFRIQLDPPDDPEDKETSDYNWKLLKEANEGLGLVHFPFTIDKKTRDIEGCFTGAFIEGMWNRK